MPCVDNTCDINITLTIAVRTEIVEEQLVSNLGEEVPVRTREVWIDEHTKIVILEPE